MSLRRKKKVSITRNSSSSPLCSEEPPPQKDQYNKAQRAKGPILLQHQLPINPHSRPPVFLTIIPQPRANLAHPLETVPAIQQILNILGHDLGHIAQLVIQLVEILRRAGVTIGRFGFCNKVIKLHKRIGPQRRVEELGHGVHGGELGGEVGEVGEGEFAGVGAFGDAEVDYVLGDEVVDGVGAGFDGGLGFRVAVEAAEDEFDLGFDFREGGFCLWKRRAKVLGTR